MPFVPISLELISRLRSALTAFQADVHCACGAKIWVIGSAEVGYGCFTCITGEAWPRVDYEIEQACVDRSRRVGRTAQQPDPGGSR